MYGGGQFELGHGRGQIQALASLVLSRHAERRGPGRLQRERAATRPTRQPARAPSAPGRFLVGQPGVEQGAPAADPFQGALFVGESNLRRGDYFHAYRGLPAGRGGAEGGDRELALGLSHLAACGYKRDAATSAARSGSSRMPAAGSRRSFPRRDGST